MDDISVMLNFEDHVEIGTIAADADVGAWLDRIATKAQSEGGAFNVTYSVSIMPHRLVRVLRTKNNRAMALYYVVIDVPLGPTRRLALQPVVGWQDSLGGSRVEPVAREDGGPILEGVKVDFEKFASTVAAPEP